MNPDENPGRLREIAQELADEQQRPHLLVVDYRSPNGERERLPCAVAEEDATPAERACAVERFEPRAVAAEGGAA